MNNGNFGIRVSAPTLLKIVLLSAPMCVLLRSSELRRAQSARGAAKHPLQVPTNEVGTNDPTHGADQVRAFHYDRTDLKGVLRPACAEHQDDKLFGEWVRVKLVSVIEFG